VDQFFEMMAYDFGLRCTRTSKTEVLFALDNLLVQQANQNRTTVLILDEAHNLSWDVLEEIRLLGNLETRQGKLLQIILAGQPELDRKLDAPDLRQLKQRVVLRCTLQPLDEPETIDYISTRMTKAGLPDQTVFQAEILSEIHLRAQGIPRLVNNICDNLLLNCFAVETKVATFGLLDEVTSDMRLEWPGGRPQLQRRGLEDSYRQTPFYGRGD
jgi:general secretion pathway protein A